MESYFSDSTKDIIHEVIDFYENTDTGQSFVYYSLASGVLISLISVSFPPIPLALLIINIGLHYIQTFITWVLSYRDDLFIFSKVVNLLNLDNILNIIGNFLLKSVNSFIKGKFMGIIIILIFITLILSLMIYLCLKLVLLTYILIGLVIFGYHLWNLDDFLLIDINAMSLQVKVVSFGVFSIFIIFIVFRYQIYILAILFGICGSSMFLAHLDEFNGNKWGLLIFYNNFLDGKVYIWNSNPGIILYIGAIMCSLLQLYRCKNNKKAP